MDNDTSPAAYGLIDHGDHWELPETDGWYMQTRGGGWLIASRPGRPGHGEFATLEAAFEWDLGG